MEYVLQTNALSKHYKNFKALNGDSSDLRSAGANIR